MSSSGAAWSAARSSQVQQTPHSSDTTARSQGTPAAGAPVHLVSAPLPPGTLSPAEYFRVHDAPFAGMNELTAEALVEQVLARNPSLAQMLAAWQAASARYPQVTSLDDPMFGAAVAPGAFGSNQVDGGYRFDISQKYPWPGKRTLRGQNALAEERAAGSGVEDTRLRLVESAKSAVYDYYLVGRALAVNRETLERLGEFRAAAEALYKTAPKERKVSLQDVLQADVEIGRQEERQLTLERMRQVAVARMNTLMHLPPDSPLPSPPTELKAEKGVPDAAGLRALALVQRPDLRALAERVRAEEASLGLAHKEYYPDFELMAAYDTMWQERPLRSQVAVRVNLPVRLARRDAAVEEASARVAQRRAELDQLTDQVSFQVQEAHAQVRESERAVQLYEKKLLSDTELNVKTARADYQTGQVAAVSVIEAERNRLTLYDHYYEIIADLFRRRATLERAIGGPLTNLPGPHLGDK